METYCFQTEREAVETAGEALDELLSDFQDFPKLLLCSGGSCLNLLDEIIEKNLDQLLTVTMLDERFTPNPEINNFLQLEKRLLYEIGLEKDVNFLGTVPRPGENMEQMAERQEKEIRDWKAENPEGKILATLGIGKDGHTAGMFPYPENPDYFQKTFMSNFWVKGYNADNKNFFSERVTSTLTFFKNIDAAIIFACGTEKKSVLKEFTANIKQPWELPALAIHQIKNIKLFTDIQLNNP